MENRSPKIIIVQNDLSLSEGIFILYENDSYRTHAEYFMDLFCQKRFQTVSFDSVFSHSKNVIGAKICLEGNLVFIDITALDSCEKAGILFLPVGVSLEKEEFIFQFIQDYQMISVCRDIYLEKDSIHAKKQQIIFSEQISSYCKIK